MIICQNIVCQIFEKSVSIKIFPCQNFQLYSSYVIIKQFNILLLKTQTAILWATQTVLIHRTCQDSRWLQFTTTHTLINAIQWLHRTSSAPSCRPEVIVLTIPCIILFRISCNSSALCSNFHITIILTITVKAIQEPSKWYCIAKHDYYSIGVIIIQPTSLIMGWPFY